jgi:RNA polymerase sigma-70 factor (ECF subfamily)
MRGACRAVNSEWDCFTRAQQGDELSWRLLVGQHRRRLTAVALLVTGSVSAAEDIVQETFLRAIKARIKHHSGTVNGFLGTIAYRLAVKEARRAKQHEGLGGPALTDSDSTALDRLLKNEQERLVIEAIRALDDKHREVLVLRFYGGYSYEEIADLLQVAIGTVKSRMFNAVKACRETLRQKGVI